MKRQLNQEIINFLNHQSDFVTSEQIAIELAVSKATVSRHIKEINSQFRGAGDTQTILSKRGRGFKLNQGVYLKQDNMTEESAIEERCNEIIKELLFVAPKRKRTYDLYEKFYVSESVISKDRMIISKKIEKWGLNLVRSNRHMSIEGNEKDIRAAIMETVLNLNQTTDISALEEYSNGLNSSEDFLFTIQQIEYASTALGISINYPYNISLFAHIYVLIERIRLFRHISPHDQATILLREEKLFSPEIYSVCKKIVDNIGQYIGVVPNDSEVVYLFEYLSTARISDDATERIYIPKSNQVALSFIERVSKKLNKKFSRELFQELENHIKYLLQRLSNQVYLPNALLSDIQVEYGDIFRAVSESSLEVEEEFHLSKISEDESGFICLYFARYIELERKKVNAYIVCTTGIGTSELIAVKVRKSFPMLKIVGVTSSIAIQKIVECMDEQIDLLITTIPIIQQVDIPIVLVSSILTNRDIESLTHVIEEIVNNG